MSTAATPSPATADDALLTSAETARRLRIRESTLIRWRGRAAGPPFIRLAGKTIRYRSAEVERWLATQQTQASTDGAA